MATVLEVSGAFSGSIIVILPKRRTVAIATMVCASNVVFDCCAHAHIGEGLGGKRDFQVERALLLSQCRLWRDVASAALFKLFSCQVVSCSSGSGVVTSHFNMLSFWRSAKSDESSHNVTNSTAEDEEIEVRISVG
uniref:Uncharacterized protein n=1 Tax=Timema douglasi TaxID=61478 RepID=A0A7R8Z855_TIMDO|nr:unnamed protein product [Timema douglasi]